MNSLGIILAGAIYLMAGGVAAQQATTLNDAQIAAITVAANQVDIDAGKLAESRAASQEVKAFAQRMVADHTDVNKSASDLVKKLKIKPQENESSKALKAGGEENMKKLKELKGAAFDQAYLNQEVTFHQTVLDTIDQSLLPNAKNEELKALLNKVRPSIASHLDHAKQLQASLGKKGG
jgi:putative membrane protein